MATIPSISLIPSGYKAGKVYSVLPTDGSGDLDFARTSTATRVNSSSLIEEVGIGKPRLNYSDGSCPSLLLEPSSTNLITQSEEFANSYWTKSGSSIQGDLNTAGVEKITNGNFATDTDWDKGAGWTISGGSLNASATDNQAFQLNTGIVTNKIYKVTYTISNYVSGSVRIELGGFNVSVGAERSANGTYTEQIVALGNESILIDAITSFTGSIDNVSVKEVQGFASPSVDSPLGAFKLVEDTSTGFHRVSSSQNIVVSDNYTHSVLVKAIGVNWIQIRTNQSGGNTFFDIENGIIGTDTSFSSKIEDYGNGWFRCSVTGESVGTGNTSFIYMCDADNSNSYTGDGTSGVYIFGAQLEAQSSATSYIKTSGTAISRTADSASKSGISSLINSSEGVLYLNLNTLSNLGTYRQISLSDSTSSNEIFIGFLQSTGLLYYFVSVGGITQSNYISNIPAINIKKIALKWSVNNFSLWVDGISISEDTSGTTFTQSTLNTLKFSGGNGQNVFNGNCKDLRVYNTALTDSELQTLTTI